MKRFVTIAVAILIVTLVLGFAAQQLGVRAETSGPGLGDELRALGLPSSIWPLIYPTAGALLLGLNVFLKRCAIRDLWRSEDIGKAAVFTAISILFGPIFALIMQSFVVLTYYDAIEKAGMMTILALFYFAFVLAFGNYVAAAKRTIGGGFNTPWTRDNDVIWRKTQRFLGQGVMIVTLFALIALYFVQPKAAIYAHVASLICMKITALGYSYTLWRKGRQNIHAVER